MKKKTIIHKIITGGQSGVDRSALDFSIKNNIPHGGHCPKNRWAEDGPISITYNLTETLEELPEYRTLKNILESDGTLVIYRNSKDEGTNKTIELCKKQNKPFIQFDFQENKDKKAFNNWLQLNSINVLNVAGPRESNSPGIYNETSLLLEYFLIN